MASGRRGRGRRRSFVERRHELAKGVGAMTNLMLQRRVELAEGLVMADRHEHRVIAEASLPTWRPDENTVDASVEGLRLSVVGPGNRQRAGEVGGRRGVRLGRF